MAFTGGLFVVGFVISLVFGVITVILFSTGRIGVRQFALWETMLVGLLVFSVVPGIIDFLAGLIGVVIQPSMEQQIEDVTEGTLDYILTKPQEAQVLVSVN